MKESSYKSYNELPLFLNSERTNSCTNQASQCCGWATAW